MEGRPIKHLIVDDSRLIRRLLQNSLEAFLPGSRVLTAGDGWEAYRIYAAEKPDFTITDLLMPGMNGLELIAKIKQDDPGAAIIVFTADVQRATRQEVIDLGVSTFINKPLNQEKIRQIINIIQPGGH